MNPKRFIQFYETYCKENKLRSKIHLLENKHLKINADRLVKEEWTPIFKALKCCSSDLHSITIISKYLLNSAGKSKEANVDEPDFLKENLLKKLIKAICICIINSDILCSVCLEGFPLSCHVEMLVDSLKKQNHLQHLSIPNCVVDDESLIRLCRTIAKHTGLQTIDLSGCCINNNGAQQISTLIRNQKLVRYGEAWKQSLRYRTPTPDFVPGLQRITLNDNPNIGDEGFKVICHELYDDLWLKAIDFQNCGITDLSSDFALDLIKTNPNLKILDLRRNSIPLNVIKYIAEILLKGCGDCAFEWINSTIPSRSVSIPVGKKTMKPIVARTCSAPISHINQSIQKLVDRERRKPMGLSNKLPHKNSVSNKEILNNQKTKAQGATGELERTKNILHKVASRLFEERSKREALEKSQKQYKDKLDEIRVCLKQHSKINTAIGSNNSIRTLTSFPPRSSSASRNGKVQFDKVKSRSQLARINKVNKRKSVTSLNTVENSYCIPSQSMKGKLLVLLPKPYDKNLSKFSSLNTLNASKVNHLRNRKRIATL